MQARAQITLVSAVILRTIKTKLLNILLPHYHATTLSASSSAALYHGFVLVHAIYCHSILLHLCRRNL